MSSANVLHSSKSPNWGTPPHIVALCRHLLDDRIDLDPASSDAFNQVVGAVRIYTEHNSGLDTANPWFGHVFLNPPGKRGLVRQFWLRLISEYAGLGNVTKAAWTGFAIGQLSTLQRPGVMDPLDFSTVVLRKRIDFLVEDTLQPHGAPAHPNYLTFLGVPHDEVQEACRNLGRVLRGVCSV